MTRWPCRHNILVLLLVLWAGVSYAQKEANHWYFGTAALDFNPGAPVALTNSAMNALEACASISDAQGNLLFYTNGTTVYNANHQIMQNGTGINGHISSTQGALIIKQPGNSNIYYLFTISVAVGNYELYYHVIDMNANSGLGNVITPNVLVYSNTCEKQTAIQHQNGSDVWIISRPHGVDQYYAHLLTPSGLSSTPVISTGVLPINLSSATSAYRVGQMKSNMSGTMLATGYYNTFFTSTANNSLELLDFNKSTGVLSNPRAISQLHYCYGVEFSPNDQFLYVTGREVSNPTTFIGGIYQFDLSTPTAAAITSSQINISSPSSSTTWYWSFSQLQLAPDGKIYNGRNNSTIYWNNTYLSRIEYPNVAGMASTYQDSAVYLNGKISQWGLPNIPMNLYWLNFTDSSHCFGDTTSFQLTTSITHDSIRWNFGDPASGSLNTSTDSIGKHVFSSPGTYWVTLSAYAGGSVDTAQREIEIFPIPYANLGPDTILCEGDSIAIQFADSAFNYLWNTGDTIMQLQILQPDTYSVSVSNVCGVAIDTVTIDSLIEALVKLPNDTILCPGQSLLLDATVEQGTYQWNYGQTDSAITVDTTGIYSVIASNLCGMSSDTIQVGWLPNPTVDLGPDTAICTGASVLFDIQDTASTYQWYNGVTASSLFIWLPGVYWAQRTNFCDTASDTVQVYVLTTPVVDLGSDSVLCAGVSYTLYDSVPFASYSWNTGAVTDSILVTSPDTYSVTVDNGCGIDSSSVMIDYDSPPVVQLGPDGTFCSTNTMTLDATWSRATYLWQDSSTDSVLLVNTDGTYYVDVTNLCGSDSDTITLEYDSPIQFELGNDSVICNGDSAYLYVSINDASLLWNTGNTTSWQWAFPGQYYRLEATNACGTVTDDISFGTSYLPQAEPFLKDTICVDEEALVSIQLDNEASIRWFDGETSSTRFLSNSGNYPVRYLNECGVVRDTFRLTVEDYPTPNLGRDTILCDGDTIWLSASANEGYAYQWSTDENSSQIMVTQAGTYTVTVASASGCETEDIILIDNCGTNFFIPTAFTPNNDGLNDVFRIVGSDISKFRIQVFDRWGGIVFDANDITNYWNGQFNNTGQRVSDGTYAYMITYYKLNSTVANTLHGEVHVLR